MKKNGMKILIIPFTFICILLCLAEGWAVRTWVNLTMDEMVFYLTSNLEGTSNEIYLSLIFQAIIPLIVIFTLVCILLHFLEKRTKIRSLYIYIALMILDIAVLMFTIFDFASKTDVVDYINNMQNESTFVEDNYVRPSSVNIVFPEKKRNLIFIFLESMEITYSDKESGGDFKDNVIPELTKIALENECFNGSSNKLNGGYVMPGTTWTMGAMMGESSGLPLVIDARGGSMDSQNSFFPRLETLGDILSDQGYNQRFLIGSRASFGGRDTYYTDHGNYGILDYDWAIEKGKIPSDYFVFWGYEDKKLFENAKEQLEELSMEEAPFNMTLLTVDTHFEDGYECDLCENKYDDQYSNVMACASKQIDEFLDWIKEQPFYENTTVVLCGDHLTMDSDYCETVDSEYERRVYTSFINSEVPEYDKNMARSYTTLDIFPTTIAALGATIEGDRLGLGTNLFGKKSTLTEEYGVENLVSDLSHKSRFIEDLAEYRANPDCLAEITEDNKLKVYIYNVDKVLSNNCDGVRVYYKKNIWKKCVEFEYDDEINSYYCVLDISENDIDNSEIKCYLVTKDGKELPVYDIVPQVKAQICLDKAVDNNNIILALKNGKADHMFPSFMYGALSYAGSNKILNAEGFSSYMFIHDNQDVEDSDDSQPVYIEGVLSNGMTYSATSNGADDVEVSSIVLNGEEYMCDNSGMFIIMIDRDSNHIKKMYISNDNIPAFEIVDIND